MKNAVILILFLLSAQLSTGQTVKTDSLTDKLKSIVIEKRPSFTLTRSAALDRAAECQARYMLKIKKATHDQPAGSGLEQPKDRVKKQGINPQITLEVAWFAPVNYYSPGQIAAVEVFKGSKQHWLYMTECLGAGQWLYGYCRLKDGEYEVCVIVYAAPK